jgi:DNA-binding SARP family transcriptional activator
MEFNDNLLVRRAIRQFTPDIFYHPVWRRFGAEEPAAQGKLSALFAAVVQVEEEGDLSSACSLMFVYAAEACRLKAYPLALDSLEQAERLARRIRNRSHLLWAWWGAAAVSLQQGAYQESAASLRRLHKQLKAQGDWILANLVELFHQAVERLAQRKPSLNASLPVVSSPILAEAMHALLLWGIPPLDPGEQVGPLPEEAPPPRGIKTVLKSLWSWMSGELRLALIDTTWGPRPASSRNETAAEPQDGKNSLPAAGNRPATADAPGASEQPAADTAPQAGEEGGNVSPPAGEQPATDDVPAQAAQEERPGRHEKEAALPAGPRTGESQSVLIPVTGKDEPATGNPSLPYTTRPLTQFVLIKSGAVDTPRAFPQRENGPRDSVMACCFYGSFRVSLNDHPVTEWPSQKSLSILKYLAVNQGRPAGKELLMDLFWADADPEVARRNLHQAIYALRKALKRGQAGFPFIQFENDCYLLNPQLSLWLDFQEFEKHFRAGRQLEEEGRLPGAMSEYGIADGYYQGDFLEDDLYEDWPGSFRIYYHSMYLELLERLSHICIAQNQLTPAILLCKKILARDNCSEQAYRTLIRCYLAQGQRQLAIREYQGCVQALKKELNLDPSPETQALYEKIFQPG